MSYLPVELKKYKIRISPESKKTQGLQTGDIVRRQYFDGARDSENPSANEIYSLMCVIETGVERDQNPATELYEDYPYFIGVLLEGTAPKSNELLDFVRVTNLFNLNRSGALYLTSSDSESPFLDVIDGIGRNKSLCWPEGLATENFADPMSEYIVDGIINLNVQYHKQHSIDSDLNRILTVTKTASRPVAFSGLKQDFYERVQRGDQVIISYKARASQSVQVPVKICYVNEGLSDAEWTETFDDDWQYIVKVVSVRTAGRHMRTFRMDFQNLQLSQEIQVADFNIILLSSVSNFAQATVTRIGKLDGVYDPVYGNLKGHGAYLERLYASKAAHVSGTLTAGDENGFAATFYAGKIHRNCFVGSTDICFLSDILIDSYSVQDPNNPGQTMTVKNFDIANPVGIGHTYKADGTISFKAQSEEWLAAHKGERYTFSFWVYAKAPATLSILQNGKAVGAVHVELDETHEWRREKLSFDLLEPQSPADLTFNIVPFWQNFDYDNIIGETNPNEQIFFFAAPQLEKGDEVTQYQATDETLRYTDNYGAWFSEGGIGGTIQNPLLRLNENGDGAIESRGSGFKLQTDGSGHLAQGNIEWDPDGNVTFGPGVHLNWDNLDDDTKNNIATRFIRITGEDTFTIITQDSEDAETAYSPASIVLKAEETGFTANPSQRQWFYKNNGVWTPIPGANNITLEIFPDSEIFERESYLNVQCVVTLGDNATFSDTKTIRKIFVKGYTVEIVSSKGNLFINGECQTVLKANVYYQGQLVTDEDELGRFTYTWYRYDASDLDSQLEIVDHDSEFGEDRPDTITLDYDLTSSEIYVCEIGYQDYFDYVFPITF